MGKYITEKLAAGIIRPSSSPVAAGFFFVEKKNKTLRPSIDYRGLNKITIRNKYPPPLLASTFELLQGRQSSVNSTSVMLTMSGRQRLTPI